MRWNGMKRMSNLFGKKKKRKPRCPECGNRAHNKELKPKVWRCSACHHKFVSDKDAERRLKRKPKEQIGEDIEDVEDFEIY